MLLIRGVTDLPPEMHLVGDYLHRRGPTVSAPSSPGYGSSVEQMNGYRCTDRTDHVDKELVALHDSGRVISVDSEWETVAGKTYHFIRARLPGEG
jgi:esterase/lipase